MTGVFIRGEVWTHTGRAPCKDRDTQTQKEDGHAKMEAEIGVMLLYTMECLGLPEAGNVWEGLSSGSGESMALPTP